MQQLTAEDPHTTNQINYSNDKNKVYTGPGSHLKQLDRTCPGLLFIHRTVSHRRSLIDGSTAEPRLFKYGSFKVSTAEQGHQRVGVTTQIFLHNFRIKDKPKLTKNGNGIMLWSFVLTKTKSKVR